jgi:AhpD family alkylhydroperoxidase
MQRLNHKAAAPDGYKKLAAVHLYLQYSGLEANLLEMIYVRASQINGCAWCLNLHTGNARKAGESEQRLYLLNAWRDTQLYTPRERAALEWTEAITLIAGHPVPDDVYSRAREQFSDTELTNLTIAIGMINVWNRLNIAFQTELRTQPTEAEARQ